jgi:hypothetical protein
MPNRAADFHRVNVAQVRKSFSVCIECFEQEAHRCVFCPVADENHRVEAHAVFDVARSPTIPQICIAEVGARENQVGRQNG